MKFSAIRATAVAGAITMVSAQNTTAPTPTEACAVVSSTWAAQISATATPTVEASIAFECLNSVPINKDGALRYIASMKPYIKWQSDVVFKANVPDGYYWPSYDILAVIDEINANIEADEYANEYEWQQDLYTKLWGPGKDGHFVNYPDILTNALQWQRPFALVSISDSPSGAAPEIKLYSDIISSPETASVLTEINGEDAETFLLNWVSKASGNQDVDAAYNSLFYEQAFVAELASTGYFQNGGRTRYIYPGDTTSFKFENGTFIELPNTAQLKGDWTGVVDGPSFFATFAPGAASKVAATTTAATATPTATTLAAPTGYPEPMIVSSDGILSGYYLEGEGFDDTAVLVALSFSPDSPVEFQDVAQEFFAQAKADGKTNLVVDVSANGGGYIFSGYDLFRQLFPDIVQEGLGRWPASDGFQAVARTFSADSANFDPDTSDADTIFQYESVFNWRYDLDESNKHFTSFEDKFGPLEFLGVNYTDVMQWDFNDPLNTINETWGFGTDITGYRSRANFTRPFKGPENIVVLLDGFCASTCTLFSQFMFHDAGVKSIAMGGRPSKEGLIQGVGGVKGSQSLGYANVLSYVQEAQFFTNDTADLAILAEYDEYVIDRSQVTSLNAKDEIYRDHLDDGLPAQFVAEYSDCRLFWTEAMIKDVTEIWKAAATSAFLGGECAYGGIEQPAKYKSKRSLKRPAPFNKPRFAFPGDISRPPIKRAKSYPKVEMSEMQKANLYMKAIN
ncbi:hypothetical protein GGR57DRAFT_479719 [Xylariaceae sp. FL1272]|nr:hypothetical protein GGR57DRAFT_479719 [Xylariaceae sp. FL1272]